MEEAVETIERGITIGYINDDDESLRRLFAMRNDLIKRELPICDIDGKRFSRKMTLAERLEWMRRRLAEGADGARQIVEKTRNWKLGSMTYLEMSFIAYAEVALKETERS